MRNNQIKILNFFKVDLSQLKEKEKSVNLIREEVSNDERGELKRSVYEWRLDLPILIFNHVEQIEFNNDPLMILLKNEETTYTEFEKVINDFVSLIGSDINDQGCLAQIEPSIIEDYHSRTWSINENHQNLKNEYPPEGKGYLIIISRNKSKSEIQIIGFLNLFNKKNS